MASESTIEIVNPSVARKPGQGIARKVIPAHRLPDFAPLGWVLADAPESPDAPAAPKPRRGRKAAEPAPEATAPEQEA